MHFNSYYRASKNNFFEALLLERSNMKLNLARVHETRNITDNFSARTQLERALMSCLLWEDTFYESGVDIATRITDLVKQVSSVDAAELAVQARVYMGLRHAPLLMIVAMLQASPAHKAEVRHLIARIVTRPDQMGELLAIYWKNGKKPLAAQLKRGLADVFGRFDEYQLAKYNRDSQIKLRDILFLTHPRPQSAEQQGLWNGLVNNTLAVPNTWETRLSSGEDKKEVFEDLLRTKKLGGVALISNLRNMSQAKVNSSLVLEALSNMRSDLVFPYRYMTAAKYAPEYRDALESKMLDTLRSIERLPGKTVFLVDVSGSMESTLAIKSEVTRMQAATALAVLLREVCQSVDIFTFSSRTVQVAGRGFALVNNIIYSQDHHNTDLGSAIRQVAPSKYDRTVIITDEQHNGRDLPGMPKNTYILNVASYQNGIDYDGAIRINGFSEHVVRWLTQYEQAYS